MEEPAARKKRTYYAHYSQFFDRKTGKWDKSHSLQDDSVVVPFKFDSNEESDSDNHEMLPSYNDLCFDEMPQDSSTSVS